MCPQCTFGGLCVIRSSVRFHAVNSLPPARITAQDFYDYDKCPHRVFLNRFGDPNEKLPNSDFLNLLFEHALTHEHKVVEDLSYVTPEGTTLEDRALSTMQLMRAGVERIYQGVLLQPDKSGIPDLLERVPGISQLGDFFYKPVDIKSGSGYEIEAKGILRTDYGMQLYHYGMLLEAVQGMFPPEAEILNRAKKRLPYPLGQFKLVYDETIAEIQLLSSGASSDEPALSSDCGACQWWAHCEKALVATEDVTLLADVGRSKKIALNSVGVRSIRDVLTFDFSRVKLKGIGPKIVESMTLAASSVLSNKLQVLAKAALPDAPRKIYLDFEDDPTQELIYLCGMWVEPALGGLNYHGLLGVDEAGEEKIWADLQQLCVSVASEDFTVFHYSSYERTKISALERKYSVSEKDALELFKTRMVDLYPVVKRSAVLPARGYGLKRIAPFVGVKYSAQNAGGAQSIVWFQEYQRNPSRKDILETLLTYNREDCVAMKSVEEWLRRL
ncbi:MAG: TM0106 family RecB-like putative nuclease [Candidatus Acidiferrales bacterium]